MRNKRGMVCLAVAIVAIVGFALAQEQLAKLTAPDGTENDYFGYATSISGNVAMIGAAYDDTAGPRAGAVYVYRYDGTQWVFEDKLIASDATSSTFFGFSVSVSGDVAVVGAVFGDSSPGTGNGAAYAFRYNGAEWVEEQKLIPTSPLSGVAFYGFAASASGSRILVGAPNDSVGGNARGACFVFRYDGTAWVEEAKLTASDGTDQDQLGTGAAIFSGGGVDVAVAGAPNDTPVGPSSGSLYVFRRIGTGWVEEAKLVPGDLEQGDFLGHFVAIEGSLLVGGARRDENLTGAAYVYRFDGVGWNLESKLFASDGESGDNFGLPVSLSGDTLLIGSEGYNYGGPAAGAVYMFRYDGAGWVESAILVGSDTQAGDACAVGEVDGNLAVIGAPFNDNTNGIDAGAAYAFKLFDIGDPGGLLEELIRCVRESDIPEGTKTSLLAKLHAAQGSLNSGNEAAVLGSLGAFLNAVAAQSGKKLPTDLAETFTAKAQAIVDYLEGS